MVVAHLETYIDAECPEILESGNLKELINQEMGNGRGTPTVVVDASAILYSLQSSDAIYHLWQPSIIQKNVNKFVENIISCGANLIVVLRGNTTNLKSWFNKKKHDFLQKEKDLQGFMEGKIPEFSMKGLQSCVINAFTSISNEQYRVFRSVDYVHKEVAEVAYKENCLAVIGQDSNYLMYKAIKYYIPTKSINIETFDCQVYNREKLMEHFGLNIHQLPLFSTLCGNDVIHWVMLQTFHQSFSGNNKFFHIADVVRPMSRYPYKHVKDLVNLINNHKINYSLIKESLDMYLNFDKTVPKDEWLVFANERKKSCKWCNTVHMVFTLRQFRSTDKANGGVSLAALLRPLRKKMYGILLYECKTTVVDEYCLEEMGTVGKNPSDPVQVLAHEPQCEHPGLIRLYDNDTPNVYFIRWKLFCGSVDGNLNCKLVRCIPPKLLFSVLALRYLATVAPTVFPGVELYKKTEVEIFLVAALLIHENRHGPYLQSSRFDGPNPRLASLITIFTSTYSALEMLNETCGFIVPVDQSCICNVFDGVLLHFIHEKMSQGAKWCEFFGGNLLLEVLFSSLLEIALGL